MHHWTYNYSYNYKFLDITSLIPKEPPPESLKNIEQMPQESINRIREVNKKIIKY
jgi:hypothetical protein